MKIIIPLFFCLFLSSCQTDDTLFTTVENAGVAFENKLTASENQNILAYEYFYNGAGVAAADFNNDGLTDLFFVGNQVDNKLYLNKTDTSGKTKAVQFEDITQKAGVTGRPNAWKTGVAVADVNADGWLDIYLCYSGNGSPESRKNQLFINTGSLPSGEGWGGAFTEQAEAYGIADAGYSTQATFFDYDRDGDLDLFVMNHNLKNYQRKEAAFMKAEVDANAGDRLYRNDGPTPVPSLSGRGKLTPLPIGEGTGVGLFTDITLSAGIKSNPLGFGLGVVVADFNQDNWPDLYVANDYVEEDYLYLNQANGTFAEVAKEAMGHFSYSAMGCDAADINNDGLPDLFTADMLPEDNRRQKLLAFPDNWNVQRSMLDNGFHWQNMRNMLQLNNGGGFFSEIGQLAGVSNTDWSWSPLFADFDNDGHKDLFITNGFVRDLSDLDFVKYLSDEESKKQGGQASASLLEQVKQMPTTPTHHYIFRNKGDLTFENTTDAWGFGGTTIAAGSVSVDLDNDGDLDIVTNNTNEAARIYQNQAQQKSPQSYLKINLKSEAANPFALGAKVYVFANGQTQYQENWPTHGFQSSNAADLHFGLKNAQKIDSIKIVWPNGKVFVQKNLKVNQKLNIDVRDSMLDARHSTLDTRHSTFDTRHSTNDTRHSTNDTRHSTNDTRHSTNDTRLPSLFTHIENLSIDFNRQILLPRLYSNAGPRMAVGDVNGDGLDDFFVGGAGNQAGAVFVQKQDGTFVSTPQPALQVDAAHEDIDAVLFDADADKDMDLYVVSGGYELVQDDPLYQDRLYLNDGKGKFVKSQNAVPKLFTNKSCVVSTDFDADGDIDLFVGGGVKAGRFPMADWSYVLTNNGKGQFSKTTEIDLGLVTDAVATDMNHDNYSDIVVAAEYQPLRWLKNLKNKPFAHALTYSFTHSTGFWSRIAASDIDTDGDMDFVVGNLGLNTQLKASDSEPISLYYDDFDQNGSTDPFLTYFVQGKAYPLASRDEALEQMVSLRKKFTDYRSYSTATIEDILGKDIAEKAPKLTVTETRSGVFVNEKGKFIFKPLPIQAQFAPIYAIQLFDFNKDGKKDLILAGNNASMRIRIGKIDANYGMVFLNQGKGDFSYLPQNQSNFCLKGDIKDCKIIQTKTANFWFFTTNNGPMQGYKN